MISYYLNKYFEMLLITHEEKNYQRKNCITVSKVGKHYQIYSTGHLIAQYILL